MSDAGFEVSPEQLRASAANASSIATGLATPVQTAGTASGTAGTALGGWQVAGQLAAVVTAWTQGAEKIRTALGADEESLRKAADDYGRTENGNAGALR
ncbi:MULTISPECIES: type VII secretion target [Streptomyces]|uniref:type VII secretion target n=1 Tax=Streptomyces TaxID=1883 RepID=UPI0004AB7135|nr:MULTISPECIES: type VII secretion target [Streptomyces]